MGIFVASLIGSSLNPDVEKKRFSSLLKKNNRTDYNFEIQIVDSLKDQFFLNKEILDKEDIVANEIKSLANLKDNWDYLGAKRISPETINNALNIINSIPPSILCNIDSDAIYASSFGTIIIDFKNGGNLFSLEISKKSIGYFIELNGEDESEEDNLPIDEERFENTLLKMCHDLSIIL